MVKNGILLGSAIVIILGLLGCGGGSTESSIDRANYFPHSVGDSWTYKTINATPGVFNVQTQTITNSLGNNQYTMEIVNIDGSSQIDLFQVGPETIDILSYTYKDSTGNALRTTTCDPPFLWRIVNPIIGQSYSRTYTCVTTVLSTNETSSLTQTKTINIIDNETVDTPAGNFQNALKYSYLYSTDILPGYVWEVDGIGKVKEIRSSSTTIPHTEAYELTTYILH